MWNTLCRKIEARFSSPRQKIQDSIEDHVESLRKRWEESPYHADDPLHRLRGQALVWLFSMHSRVRQSGVPVQCYLVPFFSVLLALVFCILFGRLVHAGAYLFLIAAVLVSVRAAGLRSGFLAIGLSLLCVAPPFIAAVRGPNAIAAIVSLCSYVVLTALICVLVDSLEISRQQADSERKTAEAAARRSRFLAEASAMLESEYTYEGILAAVTRAIVPAVADWAIADMFLDGPLCRTAISHKEEMAEMYLREKQRSLPIMLSKGHPLYEALLTRQACIFSDVTTELLSPLRLDVWASTDAFPRQILFIPLAARNRLFGALTLVASSPERTFSPTDLVFARDLALRVATALDNLRLYQGAIDQAAEHARREREVMHYSSQLEREREDLEALTASLMVEARTDGLTGLFNHLTFQKALVQEFDRARREQAPLSLALLDVDRFKLYNDTFGHPAGDEVLKQAAHIMKETARESDLTARYGGEEFVVIMPDTDAQGAIQAMERVRHAIATADWSQRAVTASFGIATLDMSIQTPRELIALADDALYRSKQAGRNCVTHINPPTEAVVFNISGLVSSNSTALLE